MAKKSHRLAFIDGLRGLAACMVMLYHLGNRTGLKPITQWGYLGVGVFFVLSGFVIASALSDKPITGALVGRFFARRFIRLDIPYWANIAVTVLLGAFLYHLGGQIHHYSGKQIAAHMVYLQDVLGITPINQVYWTLCLEIQFYLALILLLWLPLGHDDFRIVILASIVVSLLMETGFLPFPRGLMLSYWWAFAIGAMVFWWRARSMPASILALAIIAAMCLPLSKGEAWRITVVASALALILASNADAMGRWLSGPVAQFLGRISYSLYLFHALIGWEAQTFALKYMDQYEALSFGIAVSIVTAWLAYMLIERPAVRLSHRIALNSSPSSAFIGFGTLPPPESR